MYSVHFCMVMLAFVAGCQHESEREVLMGLAEPRLPTFTARGYNISVYCPASLRTRIGMPWPKWNVTGATGCGR